MACDWIKMRTDLYRDPKVCLIADALMDQDSELSRYVSQNKQSDMTVTRNVMRNVTVGALVTVWGVLRHRGTPSGADLLLKSCTLSIIDDIADLPGFGDAMSSVGWANQTAQGVVLPGFFGELNVDPSEAFKSKNADRQRRFRERNSNVTGNVTRNVTITHREEESRVEKSIKTEGQTAAQRAPGARVPKLSDSEWMESIKANPAYSGIDIDREVGKCTAWCSTKNKMPSRGRILNWLNRADKPIGQLNLTPQQLRPAVC